MQQQQQQQQQHYPQPAQSVLLSQTPANIIAATTGASTLSCARKRSRPLHPHPHPHGARSRSDATIRPTDDGSSLTANASGGNWGALDFSDSASDASDIHEAPPSFSTQEGVHGLFPHDAQQYTAGLHIHHPSHAGYTLLLNTDAPPPRKRARAALGSDELGRFASMSLDRPGPSTLLPDLDIGPSHLSSSSPAVPSATFPPAPPSSPTKPPREALPLESIAPAAAAEEPSDVSMRTRRGPSSYEPEPDRIIVTSLSGSSSSAGSSAASEAGDDSRDADPEGDVDEVSAAGLTVNRELMDKLEAHRRATLSGNFLSPSGPRARKRKGTSAPDEIFGLASGRGRGRGGDQGALVLWKSPEELLRSSRAREKEQEREQGLRNEDSALDRTPTPTPMSTSAASLSRSQRGTPNRSSSSSMEISSTPSADIPPTAQRESTPFPSSTPLTSTPISTAGTPNAGLPLSSLAPADPAASHSDQMMNVIGLGGSFSGWPAPKPSPSFRSTHSPSFDTSSSSSSSLPPQQSLAAPHYFPPYGTNTSMAPVPVATTPLPGTQTRAETEITRGPWAPANHERGSWPGWAGAGAGAGAGLGAGYASTLGVAEAGPTGTAAAEDAMDLDS